MRLYEVPIEIADYDNVIDEIQKPDYVPAKCTIDLDGIDFVYEQRFEKPACRVLMKSGEDIIVFLPYREMVRLWREEGFAGRTTGGPAQAIQPSPPEDDTLPPLPTMDDIDKLIKGDTES